MIKNEIEISGMTMILKLAKKMKDDDRNFDGEFVETLFHVSIIADRLLDLKNLNISKFRECKKYDDFYELAAFVLLQVCAILELIEEGVIR